MRLSDERGQSTVMMAVFMGTFLLGFVALCSDVGYLFEQKRLAQSAADAAALAAAEESSYGSSVEQSAAYAMAKANGFDTTLATHPATVSIGTPTSGNYSGSSSYIQVIVSKPISTPFLSVLKKSSTTLTVSARAVASAGQTSPTCVCLEGQTGQDLNMSNNSKLTATGCGATVDSSSSNAVGIVGSSTFSAPSLGTVSTSWDNSSNVNNGGTISASTHVVLGISSKCNPTLPAAPTYTSSQCTADPLTNYTNGGSSYSVGPGSTYSTTQNGTTVCYTSLTVGKNSDAVNLNAGIYVISGGSLHFMSGSHSVSNTGGNGVFFYLTNGASLTIDNGANVNLSAPTSGTYSGVLLYQDSADTQPISIQGGSGTTFTGTVYAPSSNVTLGNGSGSTVSANLVANTLTMNGGGTLSSSATNNLGTLNISTAKITE